MTTLIKDIPADLKPREKALNNGLNTISNNELLAIILKCGTKEKSALDLANEILKKYDLFSLSNISLDNLKTINGIGSVKAITILASIELGKRAIIKPNNNLKITNAQIVFNHYQTYFIHEKQEKLLALYLNTKNLIIKEETIFIGTINTNITHPREILKKAIDNLASRIIIIHNHPTGDSSPSKADIEFTKQIIKASKIIDIPIIDHIIIGDNNYYSFYEYNSNLF